MPNREAFEDHRVTGLQYFGVGQPAVGHMSLDRARSVKSRARPGPASDRLIILMLVAAEGEIVHRSLAWRKCSGRGEQAIGDDLAGLDISGDDCGGIMWMKHRSFRHDKADRPHAAVVERNRIIHEGPKNIECGRPAYRIRRVKVIGLLGACTG